MLEIDIDHPLRASRREVQTRKAQALYKHKLFTLIYSYYFQCKHISTLG